MRTVFVESVEEKHDLEAQGFVSKAPHNIYVDGVPTGRLKWEFELPDEPEQEPASDVVEQRVPRKYKARKGREDK